LDAHQVARSNGVLNLSADRVLFAVACRDPWCDTHHTLILLYCTPICLHHGTISYTVLVHRQEPLASELPCAFDSSVQGVTNAPVLPQVLDCNTWFALQPFEHSN